MPRAGASSLLPSRVTAAQAPDSIRPFHVYSPDEALADLRRRTAATTWPDRETVSDDSQGVRLATIQNLAHYWQAGHDWRKAKARLNAVPQFVKETDGLTIHFIYVRSKHKTRCL